MNKDQYVYDVGVQILNRDLDIKRLEYKIIRLKKIRDDIYRLSQLDKQQYERRNTLQEYRDRILSYDVNIKETTDFINMLKQRNDLLPKQKNINKHRSSRHYRQDSTNTDDINSVVHEPPVRSKSVSRCKLRRNTPKYPIEPEAMDAVAETIIESGDLSGVNNEIKEWIERFYKKDLPNYDDVKNIVDALNEEIDKSVKELNRQRCCFW